MRFNPDSSKESIVAWLTTILSLALAILWVPVTSHCLLERLPGLEFLSCCTHDAVPCEDEEKDCAADSCAVVEEGFYKVQDNSDIVPEPVLLSVAFLLDVISAHWMQDPSGESLGVSPPHLPSSWQFVYRTAAPVRAPSLLA